MPRQSLNDTTKSVADIYLVSCNKSLFILNARRIAQLKEDECQTAVEDVMYMLIFYKFSEIRVPLVPKLSRCIYNGRLEIWPAKDWELESIHSFEVLEMVREHISTVIGLRANSSVTDSWATTQIQRPHLGRVYVASILYGYFLKSASLRHHLEQCLRLTHRDLLPSNRNSLQFPEIWSYGLANLVFGHINNVESVSLGQGSSRQEKLKCYVMGFDPETLQRCAKLKSKETVNLIEKHSCALFGDTKKGLLDTDEVILTSFSSLKRLVLEAIAFGSFLWDTEEYVNTVRNSLVGLPLYGHSPMPWNWGNIGSSLLSKSIELCWFVRVTAYLLVLIIQAFKVPGEAIHGALDQLGDIIKACFEYFLEVLMEAIGSIISSGLDLLKEAVIESVTATGSTMGSLAEKSRDSLDVVMKSLPDILDGLWEMVSTIFKDLWDNYMDALGYVTQNA
ncbi:hypothetical protein JRO89_XS01G0053200 [Xanthoceras sorbifolium]|uniref:Uncharacterized protein n=1 Tax=Xanthoceras sorbifolium TaxID=99658 RepID=A0ABQ8IIB2_9ROSI|nr:hypothetical protein JRO89_XS01G0053200 [Xanthoceras sorbifolium]